MQPSYKFAPIAAWSSPVILDGEVHWDNGPVLGYGDLYGNEEDNGILDATALSLAERAAARDGLSMSAWLSRAARREAVRTGAGPVVVDGLADALADEAELIEAERDMRAAG
jgi:hypothetical protein